MALREPVGQRSAQSGPAQIRKTTERRENESTARWRGGVGGLAARRRTGVRCNKVIRSTDGRFSHHRESRERDESFMIKEVRTSAPDGLECDASVSTGAGLKSRRP